MKVKIGSYNQIIIVNEEKIRQISENMFIHISKNTIFSVAKMESEADLIKNHIYVVKIKQNKWLYHHPAASQCLFTNDIQKERTFFSYNSHRSCGYHQ